jgi:hypothetical protein
MYGQQMVAKFSRTLLDQSGWTSAKLEIESRRQADLDIEELWNRSRLGFSVSKSEVQS